MGTLHENFYIYKVGMPPSHPLTFFFDPLEWAND